MTRLSEILKEPNFFFLWLGQIISQFGDRLTQMALIGLIYKRAPGSAYELAKLFIFVVIPVFVVGPIAGVYSDRWNRKYTMIVSDIARGILIFLIVLYLKFIPVLKPIFPIYIIVFIIFSVTRFFIPSKMSIIPSLVNQDKLLAANSLINTTGMIAAALGFGVGGLIISSPLIGLKGGLIIDALTFFISAALIALINIKTEKALMGSMGDNIYTVGTHIEKTFKLLLTDIKDGLGYMFSHRKMHFVIALLFILWSGIGASYVVMIIFIQSSLSSITKDVGLLVMFFGTGLFLGSIAYGKFGHRIAGAKAIFLSLILGGIFLTEFVIFVHIYRSFLLAALIAFLFGGALSPVMISSNTIVHELIPNELRGRVFSSLEAVMHIAFLVFMIVASIIAEYIDPVFILMAVGVVFVYCGIFGIRTMAIREARSG